MNVKLTLLSLSIAIVLSGCSDSGFDAEDLVVVRDNPDGSFTVNPLPIVNGVIDANGDTDGDEAEPEVVVIEPEIQVIEPEPVIETPSFTVIEPDTDLAEPEVNDLACLVTVRGSLSDAVNKFADACGLTEYRDCDPVGEGIYQCANYQIGDSGPIEKSVNFIPDTTEEVNETTVTQRSVIINEPEITDITPETQLQNSVESTRRFTRDDIYCSASGTSREEAQDYFSEVCAEYGFPLIDCDPTSGNWTCASNQIGNSSPIDQSKIPDGDERRVTFSNVALPAPESGIVTYTPIKSTTSDEPFAAAWMDSYVANGKCYIDSSFDNGIGDVKVSTAIGTRTIIELNQLLQTDPDYREMQAGDPVYNDIQCGNGPANIIGDEDYIGGCPGRVDLGRTGCSVLGPEWSFAHVSDLEYQSSIVDRDIVVDFESIRSNNIITQSEQWVKTIDDDNGIVWISGFSDNVAAVIEYIAISHPDTDTKKIKVVAKFDKNDIDTDTYDSIVRYATFIGVNEDQDADILIAANMR